MIEKMNFCELVGEGSIDAPSRRGCYTECQKYNMPCINGNPYHESGNFSKCYMAYKDA